MTGPGAPGTGRGARPAKDIVLHIGMAKSGSTAIQTALNGYRDGTTRYARLGRNHSVPMHTIFAAEPAQHKFHVRHGHDAATVAALREKHMTRLRRDLSTGPPRLILSGEGMSQMDAPDVAAMKRGLDPWCCSYRIIAYLRDPAGFMASHYQQLLKFGRCDFDITPPCYRAMFQAYVDLFEPGCIDWVRFDPAGFAQGSVVMDFAARLGLDHSRIDDVRANTSLSAEAAGLLLHWNLRGGAALGTPALVRARGLTVRQLAAWFPGRFGLTPDVTEQALDQDDLRWMEEQAGFALTARLVTDSEDGIGSQADLLDAGAGAATSLGARLRDVGLEPGPPDPAALVARLHAALLSGELLPDL